MFDGACRTTLAQPTRRHVRRQALAYTVIRLKLIVGATTTGMLRERERRFERGASGNGQNGPERIEG